LKMFFATLYPGWAITRLPMSVMAIYRQQHAIAYAP
jgi:hypothetical protein